MLDVSNLSVNYQRHRALEDVSIQVNPGEIVLILGANGAGKSTLLRAISGICEGHCSGSIDMDGEAVLGFSADRIVERGIALVPEGRGIFAELTVRENLTLGAYCNRAREDEAANLDRVMSLFPKLGERSSQIVRTMSGGEQQMVAIGRAMMSNPSILMLDEPSLGLSPLLCKELFQNLTKISKTGIGILLVEQNAKQSLAIADRGYLLENAHIIHADSAENLAGDPVVQKAYLGVGGAETIAPVSRSASQIPEPLRSVNIPLAPRLTPNPPVRQSADDLIGGSIDNLVANAADRARHGLVATGPASISSIARGHEERLSDMLRGIERAASNARQLSSGGLEGNEKSASRPESANAGKTTHSPVVTEDFRAPRVQVWRQRPGLDEFEKDVEWRK